MFNIDLLQRELTADEYRELQAAYDQLSSDALSSQLPAYTIAICPICGEQNIERLDTYSLASWSLDTTGSAVWSEQAIVEHCPHFTLVQPFINFNGQRPVEAQGNFGPEIPHVIGHLLDSGQCQAVIHALPICMIEAKAFLEKYSLLCVTYFSQDPVTAYDSLMDYNQRFFEIPFSEALIAPPDGCELWWDLSSWVDTGQLAWVVSAAGELQLQTGNAALFPYAQLQGRRAPYFHRFPNVLPSPAIVVHIASKPKIARFRWGEIQVEGTGGSARQLTIRWESNQTTGFVFSYFPVARLYCSPRTPFDSGEWVNLLARNMKQFVLRADTVSGLIEVALAVTYPPFERTLGVTDEHAQAERWVTDANSLLEDLRQDIRYRSDFAS